MRASVSFGHDDPLRRWQIRLWTKGDKDGFGTKLVGQRPSEQD